MSPEVQGKGGAAEVKHRCHLFLFLAVLASALTLVSSPVRAASGNPLRKIPAIGTISTGGTFAGFFSIRSFAVADSQLAAQGMLIGTLTDATGTVLGPVNQEISLPVLAGPATCQVLHLELGPLSLDTQGGRAQVSRLVLEITPQSGPGTALGNHLCTAASSLAAGTGSLSAAVESLNQILGELDAVSPLKNIPMLGTGPGGAAFAGLFTARAFVVEDGWLVAQGTLTGMVIDATGQVIGPVDQVMSLRMIPGLATCQVLQLDSEPRDLNLPGINVRLSRTPMEIKAPESSASPLRTLLCQIASLIDMPPVDPQSLAELLNRLAAVFS
jgi:hypothetical protein